MFRLQRASLWPHDSMRCSKCRKSGLLRWLIYMQNTCSKKLLQFVKGQHDILILMIVPQIPLLLIYFLFRVRMASRYIGWWIISPESIIHPVVGVSPPIWFIIYIYYYYWNFQFIQLLELGPSSSCIGKSCQFRPFDVFLIKANVPIFRIYT